MIRLIAKSVHYFSAGDEDAFFGWLKRITCVQEVTGSGRELHVCVRDGAITDADLRELIGLFHRYQVDKKQLQQFASEKNASWFRDNPNTYWHKDVFEPSL